MSMGKFRSLWLLTCMIACGLSTGCMQFSCAYAPLVPDAGPKIKTRYKYKIAKMSLRFKDGNVKSIGEISWRET